ncbi:MAG TPA: prolyl oligopeptidase family serine peptidase, partial [Vicinamibacterales bacterium]
MTFVDVQQMRTIGSPSPSPDGKWLLYTMTTPDWKEARRQTDIHLVSTAQGVASSRQMTFTKEKNETAPAWSRDGRMFAFLSNREAPENASGRNQVYLMRPDGGEARRITDAKDGVQDFAFSPDGKWLAFRAGKSGEEQLYRLPVNAIESATAVQITKHAAGIGTWKWSPDSSRIYFAAPETPDTAEKERREKKFTVNIRNMETPAARLWSVTTEPSSVKPLTEDPSFSVSNFTISRDGKWLAFTGESSNRYERNITQAGLYADLYLLDTTSGQVERLTKNKEIPEAGVSFSPDSRWLAYSAPDDLEKYSMTNARVYLRAVADRGQPARKLGESFDGDVTVGWWSEDGGTIYFNDGLKATNQVFALDVKQNRVRQITNGQASISADQDEDTGVITVNYSDGTTPPTLYAVPAVAQLGSRPAWVQLTDANPQVRGFALGAQEEITWKSKDGTTVGGVLVKPVGYKAGQRYPLIVAIHGGPAAADILSFNGGYNSQVYAGAGYLVLRPNYRGSTNYGYAFKTGIVGNYFAPGFDDIMTGVDALVAQGIADPERMGALGWSAGGHWSNWILTHTDRFKAISTGAGTSNWISMYAQSDV